VIGGLDGSGAFASALGTDGATIVLDDSLVHLGSVDSAMGIWAGNYNMGSVPFDIQVHRSTFLGTGSSQRAIDVRSDTVGEVLQLAISGSAIKLSGVDSADVRCAERVSGRGLAKWTVLDRGPVSCPGTCSGDI